MTIKVGQVRKNDSLMMVVTGYNKVNFWWEGIFNNGLCFVMEGKYLRQMPIIAEYPTWQKAVNSKEFNKL
jgi:hypothetical protein